MILLDSNTAAIATAGAAILVGLVGIGNLVWQARNAGRQREHERRLAHDARTYDDRRDVLVDLAEFLQLLALWVERTAPIIGLAGEEPPELPSDDVEAVKRTARLIAFAPNEVRLAAEDYVSHVNAFGFQARQLRQIMNDPRASIEGKWEAIEATREDLRAEVKRAQALIKAALARPTD